MPSYEFDCRDDINHGCGALFEIICSMSEISELKPECPKCGQKDSVFRCWASCRVSEPPKTLGMLADKNAAKFSDDYKKYLKEHHKTKKTGEKIRPVEKILEDK